MKTQQVFIYLLSFFLFLCTSGALNVEQKNAAPAETGTASKQQITYAELESCSGWRLNKLPKVKNFINTEAPKYDPKDFKYVNKPGADPNIYFKDAAGNVVEKIAIANFDTEQIIELLKSKGITQLPPAQEEKTEL